MPPLYIFDLDGTLCTIEHRLHLLQSNDKQRWRRFYEACDGDLPNMPVIKTLEFLLSSGAEAWVFSGRSDEVWNKTVAWLCHYTSLNLYECPERLTMRPAHDHRPDDELKQKFLDHMLAEDRQRLVAVFDDRQRVVDMWRRNGVTCFQVAKGNF